MKLHDLHPAPGSRKAKRRVGRGIAAGFHRLSFGPDTSEAEVDAFLAEFGQIATRSRASRAASRAASHAA